MISKKHINAIIATLTAIAVVFTTLIYVNSKNITNKDSSSSGNFAYIDTVFNKEKVTEIDLEINEDIWNSLLENAIDEEYVNANITVNGTKYNNVGIRAKGNSSLSMVASDDTTDRYSFKVKFDEYVDGQTLDGLSKIALNNIMSDATYMKEYLSYDLLQKMGVPTPAFAFTNIKVNGEEWGLYFAVESIEEEFIERNYGSLSGNLYKPEGNEIGAMGNKENMKGLNVPAMANTEIPEGFTPPNMDDAQNSGNVVPPNMNNIEAPEGFTPPNMGNGEVTAPPNMNNEQTDGNSAASTDSNIENSDSQLNDRSNKNGFRGGMMGGGGMGSSNGANLVYTDDNKESYSDIFDNIVFKTTTDTDEDKVIEMIKNLNEGTNLEEYLNVDEILRYFAVNTFLVNLDSYASNMKHNYYLYEKDGVFEIIPWDYNLSFGAFNIGSASNAINFPIDSPVTDTLENSPLIGKLLEVDKYKESYHKYLQEIVDYVNNGTYENTIDQVNSLISDYVKNDATAFYTYEEYTSSLPELKNFGIDRVKSISAQLDGSQPSTSYGNIETSVNLTALGTQGMNNKNMDMQRPNNNIGNPNIGTDSDNDNKGNEMNPPNMDNNLDSTTSASLENNAASRGEMQRPSGNNNMNPENKDTLANSSSKEDQIPNINNKNNMFENIPNNQANSFNIKSNLLILGGYLLLLIAAIIFVAMFKRRKFKI
ncbi:CotH kinase family protein [Clostridium sp.]|uniref:CotH kinase family protein n=1 Tax=Clostridium sp. TaxID=1506 RepID=UPI002906BD08|nr:CotH kinase family protein [Clostridium sp.]MDU5107647.1 CotH kinase family protein [Clostridium sp.]